MNETSRWFEPTAETKAQQVAIVLAELRSGPRSTNELRAIGIMSPAARVLDARRAGYPISTLREKRQAVYVLGEVAA